MLLFLNIAQLVFYIGLLALLGQGVLSILAGAKREKNFFYQIFQTLNRPWVWLARWVAPRQVADHQLPFVAFLMIGVLYIAVTLAKIEHCVSIQMVGCK